MVVWSALYVSSRDVTVIYIDYVRLLAVVLFSFMCRFKDSPTLRLSFATSGWRKKEIIKRRGRRKTAASEKSLFHVTFIYVFCSLFSVHCFFLRVYLFCYIFGQIHLTNGYVRAYQWTSLLSSSFFFAAFLLLRDREFLIMDKKKSRINIQRRARSLKLRNLNMLRDFFFPFIGLSLLLSNALH